MPVTHGHWHSFYGCEPIFRIRGVCVKQWDGEVLAVGGIQWEPTGSYVMVFMDMKPEAAKYPRELLEGGRQVVTLARRSGLPAYAMQDTEIESSERFLRHLGFEPVGIEDMWRLT